MRCQKIHHRYPTDDNSTCNACIADSACGWCYTNGLGGTCRGNGFGTVGCTYAQGVWLQNAGDGSCPGTFFFFKEIDKTKFLPTTQIYHKQKHITNINNQTNKQQHLIH